MGKRGTKRVSNGYSSTHALVLVQAGALHKVAVTLTPHSVSVSLDGKLLGRSSEAGMKDGFYIKMSLDRYVFAAVDNFQLSV